MIYKKLMFKCSFLLVFMSGMTLSVYSQGNSDSSMLKENEVQTTVTYCNLSLPENWKVGNLSFNSLYSFAVNNKGEIINIKKIRGDFVGEETVKSCISKWKIAGFPEHSRFSVYFVWQHGKGWVRQEISGKGFSQVMTMRDVGVQQLVKTKTKKEP